MLKQITTLTIWFLSISTALSYGQKPSVDVIFAKYVASMGGVEHWKQLTSWQRSSYRKNGLTVHSYAKKPDQFKLVFTREEATVVKSYDGNNGWLEVKGKYQSMRPGEEIEMAEEPEFYEDLLIAKEKGFDLQLEGEERLGKVNCYKIKMTKSVTDEQWYWINKKSYLLEMVGEFSEDPAHDGIFYTTRFEDYRNVDGYLIPFTEHLIRNGTDTTSIYYTEMIINPRLDDSMFVYQPNSVSNCIRWMQDSFREHYLKSYTFTQETIIYKDETIDTATWYESIIFPNQFRIDFGSPIDQNCNIYTNDSVYAFRNGKLAKIAFHPHEFLLIEGGIFELTAEEVLEKLATMQIDTTAFFITRLNEENVAVLGSVGGEKDGPQLWISLEHGKLVKSIGMLGNGKLYEANTTEFYVIQGHHIPKYIHFFVEEELIQTERYYNINLNPNIPVDFFNPYQLSNEHWFNLKD